MKKAEASASSVSSSSSSKESASALPPATSTAYKSGPSLSSASSPTVAGSSPSSRATGSVDKNPAFRSGEDAKEQDGTKGGGVGVKEMKERKEEGRGLPSPQVSGIPLLILAVFFVFFGSRFWSWLLFFSFDVFDACCMLRVARFFFFLAVCFLLAFSGCLPRCSLVAMVVVLVSWFQFAWTIQREKKRSTDGLV